MVKVFLLSLALVASVPPGQAEMSYLHQLHVSADAGEAEALFILGLAYRDGWDGRVRTGTLAARWHELAGELDDSRATFVLTLLQREKGPVPKDEARALSWLTHAAERGDDYARVLLGEMLLEGNGVPADWPRGAEWIRRSAQAGFAPAQFRLGIVYLVGDATLPRNDIEALAWFIVAADAGSKSAREFRDEQTALLGREAARLAVIRSRALIGKTDP